jgi:hypothetical protein
LYTSSSSEGAHIFFSKVSTTKSKQNVWLHNSRPQGQAAGTGFCLHGTDIQELPKYKAALMADNIQYGYPLIEYGKFVAQMPNPTTNKLSHGRRLSTSKDRQVIRPNSDTLYTTIFMDLSSHDIQIEIPKIEERYWCYSFYDMFVFLEYCTGFSLLMTIHQVW